ncbi:hypothetical protein A2533_05070 [Candidatus Falkowbacteria bacterium RIFOXYD2_FULL_35_9]|uniref:Uncharacterized protein n=1 Tax=Candidatus Falkowbacteria bacterium RIFOXYC2_FULL_36_12 TaxID=1798002 RepID=A0A1F5SZY9_9BACT|nr:MAG: hypothetical protein A2300_01755 [Candidatus Falkowbacteria bacterium RIFOXYB2_FULL_35_7]OGF32239.1 MAG: hypothetical protein A2478_02850 [Candidatus Falkowbacteria bacterium RIFOXYC2_FULL_36_12]OGF34157.1 MAG: hypothetical protein A2223_01330 [Candidatus Falkowbacteria bacterium RIFOXYA2_FULL_35_8]OGF46430.1 MAG: hypothetical protein A2533_05070 [Candidatus Falkowbacteria bacterium RIFOXYD2_FULL_35_9]
MKRSLQLIIVIFIIFSGIRLKAESPPVQDNTTIVSYATLTSDKETLLVAISVSSENNCHINSVTTAEFQKNLDTITSDFTVEQLTGSDMFQEKFRQTIQSSILGLKSCQFNQCSLQQLTFSDKSYINFFGPGLTRVEISEKNTTNPGVQTLLNILIVLGLILLGAILGHLISKKKYKIDNI